MASSAQIVKTVARTAKTAVAALDKRTAANVPPDGMARCVNCLVWRELMARDALAAANARVEDFAIRAAGNAFARTGRNVPTIAQLGFMARIAHSLADRVAAMGDATNNLVGFHIGADKVSSLQAFAFARPDFLATNATSHVLSGLMAQIAVWLAAAHAKVLRNAIRRPAIANAVLDSTACFVGADALMAISGRIVRRNVNAPEGSATQSVANVWKKLAPPMRNALPAFGAQIVKKVGVPILGVYPSL